MSIIIIKPPATSLIVKEEKYRALTFWLAIVKAHARVPIINWRIKYAKELVPDPEKIMAANNSDLPRPGIGFSVEVVLKMTEDKGIGSFADEFIPKDAKIFIITKESKYYDEQEAIAHLASMNSEEEKRYWLSHVYEVKDKIAEDPYDLPTINHSNEPNMRLCIKEYGDGYCYALRDIEEGEELTEDYRTYPVFPFLQKLMKEHGVTEAFLNNS